MRHYIARADDSTLFIHRLNGRKENDPGRFTLPDSRLRGHFDFDECFRPQQALHRHCVHDRLMRAEDLLAHRGGFRVALDAFRPQVLDDAHHVFKAESGGVEDRADLGPGGAHLLGHTAANDDALGHGIVFGGGVAREVDAGRGLQAERERVARIVEPGKMRWPDGDGGHSCRLRRSRPGIVR